MMAVHLFDSSATALYELRREKAAEAGMDVLDGQDIAMLEVLIDDQPAEGKP